MKNIYSKINRTGFLAALILLFFASCQKKFNPNSYAPLQSFGGFSSSSQIQPSNLVGHWAFENTLVDSVSATVGTGVNTSFSTGVKGSGFQGADKGYAISVPSKAVVDLQSFTISLWVNVPQNTKGIYGLVCLSNTADFWGNFDLFFENGSAANNAVFKYHIENWDSTTVNGETSYKDNETWSDNLSIGDIWNKWTQLAVTYDAGSSTVKTYVNGSLVNTKVNAGNGPLTFRKTSALIFGAPQFNTTPSLGTAGGAQDWASYVPGKLDEIRIFKVPLTADEMKALFQLEKLGK